MDNNSNSKNGLIIGGIIVVLVIIGYFVFKSINDKAPEQPAAAVEAPTSAESVGSITAPASNATVSGTVTVSAVAPVKHFPAINKADLYVDGTAVASKAGTSTTYNFPLNTKTFATGTHTLVVKFTDNSNSVITTPAVSINIDNTAVPQGVGGLGLDK